MTPAIDSPSEERDAFILVMTAGGGNAWMIINHLRRHFPRVEVVEEQAESKRVLLARRRRRFGAINAAGQLGTMIVSRLGKRFAARRLDEIATAHGLSMTPDSATVIHHVPSLNDPTSHDLVRRLAPSVVITVSCRILSRETLALISCPVINLHSGINPAYRGQMGGYWSLVSGDAENFGATIHLVDAGVDTGDTLAVITGQPGKGDSMLTYPALLTAIAADSMVRVVQDAVDGKLSPEKSRDGPSALHFNVPLWTWVYHGLTKGIW